MPGVAQDGKADAISCHAARAESFLVVETAWEILRKLRILRKLDIFLV
jgi:predicted Fe-Mo cluster-binding NifX family protein